MEDNLVLTTAFQMIENMSYDNQLQLKRKLVGKMCILLDKTNFTNTIYFGETKKDIIKLMIEKNNIRVVDIHKSLVCDINCSWSCKNCKDKYCFICLEKIGSLNGSPTSHLLTHNMIHVNEIILNKFIDNNFVFNFINHEGLN